VIVTDYRLSGGRSGVEAAGCVLLRKPVRPDRLHHLLRSLARVDNKERQP
jgi:hypothetical protein